ncbi:hypothetical protein HDU87_006440 [Geranomyces variabilis]|uniref:Uncharacterized protein n=1 Tax=Geranomyces variabilis TaxID=109894 RepID=A0AAD5TFW5_9FUNG|nr:hypothetical protein HDU87_006440 [Geranomyces variabilis]
MGAECAAARIQKKRKLELDAELEMEQRKEKLIRQKVRNSYMQHFHLSIHEFDSEDDAEETTAEDEPQETIDESERPELDFNEPDVPQAYAKVQILSTKRNPVEVFRIWAAQHNQACILDPDDPNLAHVFIKQERDELKAYGRDIRRVELAEDDAKFIDSLNLSSQKPRPNSNGNVGRIPRFLPDKLLLALR